MGHGDQANRLLGCTNTWKQHSKAVEQMMLTWDEKVEKQPTATELGLKEKKREEEKEEGKKSGNPCFRRKWKAECREVTHTVWSHKTGASLQALRKYTGMDKVANVRMLKA